MCDPGFFLSFFARATTNGITAKHAIPVYRVLAEVCVYGALFLDIRYRETDRRFLLQRRSRRFNFDGFTLIESSALPLVIYNTIPRSPFPSSNFSYTISRGGIGKLKILLPQIPFVPRKEKLQKIRAFLEARILCSEFSGNISNISNVGIKIYFCIFRD